MKGEVPQIRSLLKHQSALVLATVDEDARPRSTPLFFICGEDLRLYWFSSRNSLHSRNCARSPRASVAIFRHTGKWEKICGVQFDGLVSVVTDRILRRGMTHAYRTRFGLGHVFDSTIRRSALYCFTPDWVRYVNNARGFGYKFERKMANMQAAGNQPKGVILH